MMTDYRIPALTYVYPFLIMEAHIYGKQKCYFAQTSSHECELSQFVVHITSGGWPQ